MNLLERLRNEGTVESTGKFTVDEERAKYWLFDIKLGGNLTKKLSKLFIPLQYLNHEYLTGEEFANQLLTGRTDFNNIYLQPHYNLAAHEKYTEIQKQLTKNKKPLQLQNSSLEGIITPQWNLTRANLTRAKRIAASL